MIFVGCASRSPAAYERGINYPGVRRSGPSCDLSLPLSLFTSRRSLTPFDYLIPPVPAITPRGRLFISLRLAPTAGSICNDSSWWDDTGSEVKTAEPRRSLNGKFELYRRGLL